MNEMKELELFVKEQRVVFYEMHDRLPTCHEMINYIDRSDAYEL